MPNALAIFHGPQNLSAKERAISVILGLGLAAAGTKPRPNPILNIAGHQHTMAERGEEGGIIDELFATGGQPMAQHQDRPIGRAVIVVGHRVDLALRFGATGRRSVRSGAGVRPGPDEVHSDR